MRHKLTRFSDMDKSAFDKQFDKSFTLMKVLGGVIIVCQVAVIAFIVYGAIVLFSNPEAVGDWFGRLVDGFNKEV